MTAKESFSVIRPQVSPYVPGCPDVVIEQEIRNAAIRFCSDTWCWRENLEPVFLMDSASLQTASYVEDETEYDLDVDDAEQVVGIVSAKIDTRSVDGNVRWDLPRCRVFVPVASSPDGVIEIRAAMAPSTAATSMPVFLRTRYGQGILSGTLARLCAVPDKPWTDYSQAQYHNAQYIRETGSARISLYKNFTGRSLSVKPRFFA